VIVPPGIAVPGSFPTGGDYLTKVVEVVGSTCVDMEVPYLYDEDWTQFRIVRRGVDSAIDETRMVYFFLGNIVGPAATPVFPYVDIWISAGEDFDVHTPSLSAVVPYRHYQGEYELQGFAVATTGEVVDDVRTLIKRVMPYGNLASSGTFVNAVTVCPVPPTISVYEPLDNIHWTYYTHFAQMYWAAIGSFVYHVKITSIIPHVSV
jgi:hypothetical protein